MNSTIYTNEQAAQKLAIYTEAAKAMTSEILAEKAAKWADLYAVSGDEFQRAMSWVFSRELESRR